MIRLLEEDRWVMGGDFDQFPVYVLPELCGDNGMSVFGRKDDVVVTEVDAVAGSSVLTWRGHASTVSQRGVSTQKLTTSHDLTVGGIGVE